MSSVKHGLKFLPAICLLVFLWSGCKRRGQVQGKVINIITGEPLVGVPITLNEHNSSFFSSSTSYVLARALSDANGEFEMDFRARKAKKYIHGVNVDQSSSWDLDTVSAIAELYGSTAEIYTGTAYSQNIGTKDPAYVELRIAPAARVKIVSKNINPVDNSDFLTVEAYHGVSSATIHSAYGGTEGYPQYQALPTNGQILIRYTVRKNWIENVYYDTIKIKPFEKTIFQINY